MPRVSGNGTGGLFEREWLKFAGCHTGAVVGFVYGEKVYEGLAKRHDGTGSASNASIHMLASIRQRRKRVRTYPHWKSSAKIEKVAR